MSILRSYDERLAMRSNNNAGIILITAAVWCVLAVQQIVPAGQTGSASLSSARPQPEARDISKIKLQTVDGYPPSIGGSHQYENIADAKLTVVNSNTLQMDVQIYLVNPTGCTIANPCPIYDNSPEYVNAWIDWNADKKWDAAEQVMKEAGTGYGSLNYSGAMNFSKLITIPSPNALNTSPVLCRVMLGWQHNPADPTENSWSWGDVRDLPLELQEPEITDIEITPAVDPMANKPISFHAVIRDAPAYKIDKVAWTGQDLTPGEGETYATQYDPKTHGNKTVKATVTYHHIATSVPGSKDKEKVFKLFFAKDDDDDGNSAPNWFEYWKTDAAVSDLNNPIVSYDATMGSYGLYNLANNTLKVGKEGANEHYPGNVNVPLAGKTFGGAKGIDCLAEVLSHELRHKWVVDNWTTGGAWVGMADSDRGKPTADFNDRLPDTFEATIGTSASITDTFDLWDVKAPVYILYGDHEYYVMTYADGAKGTVDKDWANPGKQTTPSYNPNLETSQSNNGPHSFGGCWTPEDKASRFPQRLAAGPLGNAYYDLAHFISLNSMTGVNLGGSAKYDVLRCNLTINSAASQYIQVTGFLQDSAAHPIAWATYAGTFPVGATAIDLDFPGTAIEQSGFNGPYQLSNLEIRLGDEDLNLADSQTNVGSSPAYSASDFEPPAARILAAGASDVRVGADIHVSVNAQINTPGEYTISAYLCDTTPNAFKVARAQVHQIFTTGTTLIDLTFAGKDVFFSKVDGPYNLDFIQITDASGKIVGIQRTLYRTLTYYFYDFIVENIAIGIYTFAENALDYDQDGLYEALQISFIAILQSTTSTELGYNISAVLEAADGTTISAYSIDRLLGTGKNSTVNLYFPGYEISASGHSGPYRLRALTIIAAGSGIVADFINTAYRTNAYDVSAFSSTFPFAVLAGGSVAPSDPDGDGLFESLDVQIPVVINNPGMITIEGALRDRFGVIFSRAISRSFFSTAVGTATVTLSFPSSDIWAHQVDGPYDVVQLRISHSAVPDKPYWAPSILTSGAIPWNQFNPVSNALMIALYDGAALVPDGTGEVVMGAAELGRDLTKSLRIVNTGNDTLSLSNLRLPSPFWGGFGASLLTAVDIPAGSASTLNITLNAANKTLFGGVASFATNITTAPFTFTLIATAGESFPVVKVQGFNCDVEATSGAPFIVTATGGPKADIKITTLKGRAADRAVDDPARRIRILRNCAGITSLTVNGALRNLNTAVPIVSVSVSGDLGSLSASRTAVGRIYAGGSLRRVAMTLTNEISVAETPQQTEILSNTSLTFGQTVIALAGVGARLINVPNAVQATLSAKKKKGGVIIASNVGLVKAGSTLTLSALGSDINGPVISGGKIKQVKAISSGGKGGNIAAPVDAGAFGATSSPLSLAIIFAGGDIALVQGMSSIKAAVVAGGAMTQTGGGIVISPSKSNRVTRFVTKPSNVPICNGLYWSGRAPVFAPRSLADYIKAGSTETVQEGNYRVVGN